MAKAVTFKTIVVAVACVVAFFVVGVIIENLLSFALGGEDFVGDPDDEPTDLLPTSEKVTAVAAAVGLAIASVGAWVIAWFAIKRGGGSGFSSN
jgi:hypothetical protein